MSYDDHKGIQWSALAMKFKKTSEANDFGSLLMDAQGVGVPLIAAPTHVKTR